MEMKTLFGWTILMFAFVQGTLAQEVDFAATSFEANFKIDSTFTRDGGKTFEVSASGEAGEYGKVYVSYTFTDDLELKDAGEFTGFAWTQSGETVVTATLQGTYFKQGSIFKLYSWDITSERKLNMAIGVIDFVAGTVKADVREVVVD
tara:strand:+ start:129 stop:572 length:444 start_codon:yes stop_codon:yes gene_type:complete